MWTGTSMFRAERGPLLIQTLAICLANRAFPELHFVADSRGARIRDLLGWEFSKVSTNLGNLYAKGVEHVWALGKLAALRIASADGQPVLHIDGDALLFDPLPPRLLRSPLIAQSPDQAHYYTSADMRRGFSQLSLRDDLQKYNAGILGGADVQLVRRYAARAISLAGNFRDCDINGTTSSMLVEQAFLGVFAHCEGMKVSTLFPLPPGQMLHPHYAHLVGPAKRNPQLVARFGAQLREQFPAAHAKFERGWPHVKALFPAAPRTDCGCGCHGSGDCGGSHTHDHGSPHA